jgi:hypothetical protein
MQSWLKGRGRPSPAMVVAALALFVALAGTATATTYSLITSAQIKNGTIQLADMSSTAKAALRGQRGPAGPAGPAGAAGAAGAAGPAGANGGFDPNKVTYVTGPTVSVPPGQVATASAQCPAGTKPIAGGFFSNITRAGASWVSGSAWFVIVWNEWSISVDINAFAVCASP